MAEQDDVEPTMPGNGAVSADEILVAASALAKHLSASGAQFLPAADPVSARELASGFQIDSAPAQPACKNKSDATANDSAEPVVAAPVRRSPETVPVAASVPSAYSLPTLPVDVRDEKLVELNQMVASCTRCDQLARSRTQTVFGEGNPSARVAFFGEGPGADEDRSGRPFVGRAGQLLTKMIEACTFARDDVYILNTVKCRPPGNRNPEPMELVNCREYFEQQLAIIQPEYVVCLGAVSAQTLLQTNESVGRLRGKWHSYFASKVLVTYHPAYLLRNPAAKKAAWDDLKMMLADMGIQP